MKSQNDILTIIYKLINTIVPITSLNGGVYKNTRPTNSDLEDVVISCINGVNAKFLQDGGLYVKIFFKDLFQNNTWIQDTVRASVMEYLLFDLSNKLFLINGLSFDIRSREIYCESVKSESGDTGAKQHYAILKINYKLTHD